MNAKYSIYFLVTYLLIACVPSSEKNLSLGTEDAYSLFKEVRVTEIALESTSIDIRDSIQMVLMGEISQRFNLSSAEIESIIIDIQSSPKMNKTFVDRSKKELEDAGNKITDYEQNSK